MEINIYQQYENIYHR